jgi:hypothetical protein
VPVALLGYGLLSMAASKIFYYPLDKTVFILAIFIMLGVWLLAVVVALVGVALVWLWHGGRWAAVVGIATALAFGWIVRADLELTYPHVYYQTHRAEFESAAAFAETIPVDSDGEGGARLPETARELGDGWVNVGRSEDGDRSAVIWISETSGSGYGYVYAPEARIDEVVAWLPANLFARTALGDGWWWADTDRG